MSVRDHEALKFIDVDQDYIPPEIIPEAGTGHQGSIEQAGELIQHAQMAGARTLKFQWVIASEILHPKTGLVPLPGGEKELYEIFSELEQPKEFYSQLQKECKSHNLEFLCTPFGLESLKQLLDLDVNRIKIASPELNHIPLLHGIGTSGLPVFLSTGVSMVSDIEESLGILNSYNSKVCLLHCVTSYPTPPQEYNLLVTRSLNLLFGIPVGVSDHSIDPLLIPALSGLLNCPVVEKHLGLTKKGKGLDDPIALEPDELRRLIDTLESWRSLSKGRILEKLLSLYPPELILATLGTGQKTLAPSEKAHYGRTNRSIHALSDLHPGVVLTPDHISILRTEKQLTPGLHPRYYAQILGKTIVKKVADGEGLTWDHLLSE
jgi:sialic acid synthase SpsE